MKTQMLVEVYVELSSDLTPEQALTQWGQRLHPFRAGRLDDCKVTVVLSKDDKPYLQLTLPDPTIK